MNNMNKRRHRHASCRKREMPGELPGADAKLPEKAGSGPRVVAPCPRHAPTFSATPVRRAVVAITMLMGAAPAWADAPAFQWSVPALAESPAPVADAAWGGEAPPGTLTDWVAVDRITHGMPDDAATNAAAPVVQAQADRVARVNPPGFNVSAARIRPRDPAAVESQKLHSARYGHVTTARPAASHAHETGSAMSAMNGAPIRQAASETGPYVHDWSSPASPGDAAQTMMVRSHPLIADPWSSDWFAPDSGTAALPRGADHHALHTSPATGRSATLAAVVRSPGADDWSSEAGGMAHDAASARTGSAW
ncbi:hypothetical protein [Caballeronia glathei]|nr:MULTISPECIES: hypothetical protein [Burkholderiaceae]